MAVSELKLFEKVNFQMSNGALQAALKTARIGIKSFPRNPDFPSLAGFIQAQDGRHTEASRFFTTALKLAPGSVEFQNNLLQALVLSDQPTKVDRLFESWLPTRNDPSDLHYLRAMSLVRRNSADAALSEIDAAIQIQPLMTKFRYLKLSTLIDMGQDQASLAECEEIYRVAPNDHRALVAMASILLRQAKTQEAREVLDRAAVMAPDAPDVLNQQAMLALAMGRLDDAIRFYRELSDSSPRNGMAIYQLAKLVSNPGQSDLNARIQTAEKSKALTPQDQALIAFAKAALAKAENDLNAEVTNLAQANRYAAVAHPFDNRRSLRRFERLVSFPVEDCKPASFQGPAQGPVPIFVLGLPRSGTSLLEQILTQSDEVFGCVELAGGETMLALADRDQMSTFSARDFAERYQSSLPPMPQDTRFYVDKLPGNYRVIGYLKAAMPLAKFIHLQRNAMDTALSLWRTYLSAPDLAYCFDQRSMAQEMNLYQRYMGHWRDRCGHAVLDISYEDLVHDPEGQTRKIANFCGLTWSDTMTRPETNPNVMRTASAMQVRRPVNQDAVGKGAGYEACLKVVAKSLDKSLWPNVGSG